MAKPKVRTLVKVLPSSGGIHVYTDEPEKELSSIATVGGIVNVHLIQSVICSLVDPRYDIDEVAEEIRELLTTEVPDAFQECS